MRSNSVRTSTDAIYMNVCDDITGATTSVFPVQCTWTWHTIIKRHSNRLPIFIGRSDIELELTIESIHIEYNSFEDKTRWTEIVTHPLIIITKMTLSSKYLNSFSFRLCRFDGFFFLWKLKQYPGIKNNLLMLIGRR